MGKTVEHCWNPHVLASSPLFEPLHTFHTVLHKFQRWPEIDDYQQLLQATNTTILSGGGQPITFVPQGEKPRFFEEHYEPRIYLTGEVQTRTKNWHDFFQVLVWCIFPETKKILNKRHYLQVLQRQQASPSQTNRSPLENTMTLFDECGAIILSSDDHLLNMIRDHQWKTLFWENRNRLHQELHCLIFGHAIYEKAISPYIGMTAQALLVSVPQAQSLLPSTQRLAAADQLIAKQLDVGGNITHTKQLNPFPVLGMPGWKNENNNENFYENRSYFRPKR